MSVIPAVGGCRNGLNDRSYVDSWRKNDEGWLNHLMCHLPGDFFINGTLTGPSGLTLKDGDGSDAGTRKVIFTAVSDSTGSLDVTESVDLDLDQATTSPTHSP